MVTFRVEPDGEEFHAWSPELKGVHTHGASLEKALANLREAIALYLKDCADSGENPLI